MNTTPKDHFILKSIGTIHSPYTDKAPRQSFEDEKGDFSITINKAYTEGLLQLDSFTYIYVIYFLDRVEYNQQLLLSPPLAKDRKIGLFASRTPNRPNPVGISVVKLKKITGNKIYISGIDAFDGTPVLDIKPYIDQLDAKDDANIGWIKDTYNTGHFTKHLKGIPH